MREDLASYVFFLQSYLNKLSRRVFRFSYWPFLTLSHDLKHFFFFVKICYRYCNRHPLLFFVNIMITESWCPGKLLHVPVVCQVMQFRPASQFSPLRLDVEHLLYHHPPLISRAQLPSLYWSLSLSTVENDISLAWNCCSVPPSASPILQIMNKM